MPSEALLRPRSATPAPAQTARQATKHPPMARSSSLISLKGRASLERIDSCWEEPFDLEPVSLHKCPMLRPPVAVDPADVGRHEAPGHRCVGQELQWMA